MAHKLLFCLLLACAALPASARQPAMMGANGTGGCPDSTEAGTEAEPVRAGEKRVVAPKRTTRPATARSGSDADSGARPPRWHSFLPGMIR